MTDQEALQRWLRIAWEQGQKAEELTERVRRGMPLEDARRELERPVVFWERGSTITIHNATLYASLCPRPTNR